MNSVSNSSYSTNIVFSTYSGTDAKMRTTASSGKSTSGKKNASITVTTDKEIGDYRDFVHELIRGDNEWQE